MHLLLIRFSSLGDVVLTTSLISALKGHLGKHVSISYLTSIPFAPILEGHLDLDRVYTISRRRGFAGLRELFDQVKAIHQEHPIDLFLDLHGSVRSLLLRAYFWSIPRLFVDKRTIERWLLTWCKIDILSSQFKGEQRTPHYGELLLRRTVRDLLPLFGISLKTDLMERQLSSCATTYQENKAVPFKTPYIAVVPTASFEGKRWPIASFYQWIRDVLNHPQFQHHSIVILAGKEDTFCDVLNPLASEYPDRFYNFQGKTSLLEAINILKQAQLCVGNDTGLPHLAESVGTPALFILGPTGEEFGFYPHLKHSAVASVRLWCRPCTTNGEGTCIRRKRYCLLNITPQMLLDKLLMLQKELS